MADNNKKTEQKAHAGANMLSAQAISYDFLTGILDAIADPLFVKDRQHRWVLLNDAFCKLIGYSKESLLGKSDHDFFPKHEADVFWEKDEDVFNSGQESVNEEAFTDAKGTQHTIVTKKTRYTTTDGQQILVGIIRDVTENKQTEERLRASEQQFRNLAENLRDGIIRYDRDGRIRYLNPNLLGYLGLSAADVIGRRPGEVWPDGRYAGIEKANAKAIETGETSTLEFCEADAAGVMHFNQILVAPERDDNGQIVGTLAIGRDVTAIRATEHRLSLFIESQPGMAYVFRLSPDGRGCFPFVSSAIEEIYGLKPDDVKDDITPLLMLLHPDDLAHNEAAIAESARTMTPFHLEYRVCRPGLPVRWLEARSVPEREADGSILWYGIVLDINARKQAEIALMASQRMLSEAQAIARLGSWDWDVVRNRVEWSDMAYDIYTPDERPAAPGYEEFKQSVHPDDLERVDTAVRAALEHDTPFDIEHRVVSQSQGVRTVHAQAKVFRNHNGNPIRMMGTVQDITERKRVEQERQTLAYSLERMELVNKAILGTTDLEQTMNDVLDVVLSIFECDRAFLLYSGGSDMVEYQVPMERTRPEYPGALALGVTIPMDEGAAQTMRITLDAGGPVIFGTGAEYPVPPTLAKPFSVKSQMLMALHPKLEKSWVFGMHQCSHAKIWNQEEKELFQKIGSRLSDVLTSLLMYRNLRDSEQKYRSLADNIPLALVRYDREGRRTYVNPSTERNFGVLAVDMVGKTLQDTNPLSMAANYQRALQHTLATGESSELQVEVPLASGNIIYGYILIAAERDADGEITGAITIGRNITPLKQAENQLRELNAHLQTVREEEKAHLAREIHDELGSTLASLKIQTYFLQQGLSAEPNQHALASRAKSMSQLLDSAIDNTRRIASELRPTILNTLGLFAALKWHAEQFQNHTGIECRVECISGELNSCSSCTGCHDKLDNTLSITLYRIFQETLTNVARHSGASAVESEYQFGHNEVALSIRDNGCGLPEGKAIIATSNGIRGMRERVDLLGGKIFFENGASGGLCVTVKLPRPSGISVNGQGASI